MIDHSKPFDGDNFHAKIKRDPKNQNRVFNFGDYFWLIVGGISALAIILFIFSMQPDPIKTPREVSFTVLPGTDVRDYLGYDHPYLKMVELAEATGQQLVMDADSVAPLVITYAKARSLADSTDRDRVTLKADAAHQFVIPAAPNGAPDFKHATYIPTKR